MQFTFGWAVEIIENLYISLKLSRMKEVTPHQMEELWEEDLLARYPEQGVPAKGKDEFRNYDDPKQETVREFYRVNHLHQTYDFVLGKQKEFLKFDKKELTLWEAVEFLNTLVVLKHNLSALQVIYLVVMKLR